MKEQGRGPRVADHLRERLADIIRAEMRDPRVGMVSVNDVRVSRDLAYADIFVSSSRRRRCDGAEANWSRARTCGRIPAFGGRARQHDAHDAEAALSLRRTDRGRRPNRNVDSSSGGRRRRLAEAARGWRLMARRQRGRDVSGMIVVDKPGGMSSNDAVQRAKQLYQARKVGHTGSLDPLATGVLPLCFGEATKFSQFLLDSDKKYWARIKLGVRTDSGDADGTGARDAAGGRRRCRSGRDGARTSSAAKSSRCRRCSRRSSTRDSRCTSWRDAASKWSASRVA